MKKLRFPALLLAAILAFTCLASCNRRKEFEELYESEQESKEEQNKGLEAEDFKQDVSSPNDAGYGLTYIQKSGDKGYYEGKTKEELAAMFTPSNSLYAGFNSYRVTPNGLILQINGADHLYYNKQTGNLNTFCPDPLCDDNECVLHRIMSIPYIDDTHIYFTVHQWDERGSREVLYRCDLERNNVELIYDGGDHDIYYIYLIEGDTIYTERMIYREGRDAVSAFASIDMKTGECTILSNKKDSLTIFGIVDGHVYFSKNSEYGHIYRADLQFKNVEEVFTEYESTEKAIGMKGEDYLVLSLLKNPGDTFYTPILLYNAKTGKETLIEEGSVLDTMVNEVHLGNYLYYTRNLSDEEIDASPLKDYYRYEKKVIQEHEIMGGGGQTYEIEQIFRGDKWDGRIYRLNLETMEEEVLFRMTYNGIPVEIYPGGYVPDGNIIFFQFGTYLDTNNYFNQDFNLDGQRFDFANMYYAVADLSNGTVNFIDVSEFIDESDNTTVRPRKN